MIIEKTENITVDGEEAPAFIVTEEVIDYIRRGLHALCESLAKELEDGNMTSFQYQCEIAKIQSLDESLLGMIPLQFPDEEE